MVFISLQFRGNPHTKFYLESNRIQGYVKHLPKYCSLLLYECPMRSETTFKFKYGSTDTCEQPVRINRQLTSQWTKNNTNQSKKFHTMLHAKSWKSANQKYLIRVQRILLSAIWNQVHLIRPSIYILPIRMMVWHFQRCKCHSNKQASTMPNNNTGIIGKLLKWENTWHFWMNKHIHNCNDLLSFKNWYGAEIPKASTFRVWVCVLLWKTSNYWNGIKFVL